MTALSPARAVQPYNVVRDFEAALCEYTGAPFAVTTNSCTMALLLAVAWHMRRAPAPEGLVNPPWVRPPIEIPKRTYVSVPMSIIHAGGRPTFRDQEWRGVYQLRPLPVWDSARWFTGALYQRIFPRALGVTVQFICVSFHWSKTLGIQQGGAILHDDAEADAWLRKARFDGREEGVAPRDQHFDQIGWHCYMSPEIAAEGLMRLSLLPRHNEPLQNDDYPDLSKMEIFK
jgi:dTDP-4-amino-4,6-dideoxygalactose transaminase